MVHYHIQKEGVGEYSIDQGDKFSTPIHIVNHYHDHLGGLITKATKPCMRKEGVPLLSYKFVPQRQLTEAAKLAAIKVGVSVSLYYNRVCLTGDDRSNDEHFFPYRYVFFVFVE